MTDKELTEILSKKVREIQQICKKNNIEYLNICCQPDYFDFHNNHWETGRYIRGDWFAEDSEDD